MTSGRPLASPAQIRHKSSLRRPNLVNVKVFPGDGRAFETFAFDSQELRRFAWAILADYDPEEAKACAAESGTDISDLIGKARLQNVVANPAKRREAPITAGSDDHTLLAEIAGQDQVAMEQLKKIALSGPHSHKVVLQKLRTRGLVERADAGRQGSRAIFEITEAGRTVLTAVAAGAPSQALAA